MARETQRWRVKRKKRESDPPPTWTRCSYSRGTVVVVPKRRFLTA